MPKILGFLVLLVLAASVLACGSSLSVEDYAEECGEWNEDYAQSSSMNSVRNLEDALDEWNALAPPREVKALHDLRTEALKLSLEIAKENEELEDKLDDLRDELDDARRSQEDDIRDEMDDLRDEAEDRVEDLEDDLSRGGRRDLNDEGCI